MDTKKRTAFIADVPVAELMRPLATASMRANYLDVLLQVIVEAAEQVEASNETDLRRIVPAAERIRAIAEIAQILNGTLVGELESGERYLRDHQIMRLAA